MNSYYEYFWSKKIFDYNATDDYMHTELCNKNRGEMINPEFRHEYIWGCIYQPIKPNVHELNTKKLEIFTKKFKIVKTKGKIQTINLFHDDIKNQIRFLENLKRKARKFNIKY